MSEQTIQWKRMRFKKNKVWAELAPDGSLLLQDGRVRIKYQLDQSHEYRVYPHSLEEIDPASPQTAASAADEPRSDDAASPPADADPDPPVPCSEIEDTDEHAVRVYTDGASSGNPGPSGIGVVLQWGEHEKEISRYIGMGTNNIAELEAIRVALKRIHNTALPVRVYTDSSYAIGVLCSGWKAKKNRELIQRIQKEMGRFDDIRLIKVRGHAGHPQNERADRLAVAAVSAATADNE